MNPYADDHVRGYLRAFLDAYFADNTKRVLVFGINPGRFGAGVTGVTFTDPVALADECGIENSLPRRRELSSIFIYKLIERYGGARKFYSRFFLTAVCPLGFTRNGKNLNYYDDPALARAMTPFIRKTIEQQIALGGRPDCAIVLGAGENFRFMRQLNDSHGFFREVLALEHPRWIMQYRLRQVERYLAKYEEVLGESRHQRKVPAVVTHRVQWTVVGVRALDGHRLWVHFVDGTEGEADISRLVFGRDAGVFKVLRDADLFAQVGIDQGAVTWPGGLDLAPDAMYDEIKANGRWTAV